MWRVRDASRLRLHRHLLLTSNRSLTSYSLDLRSDHQLGGRPSRRQLGFLGGVLRSVVARAAVVLGGLGAVGYTIDEKIRDWEDNTYRPIVKKLDRFKELTRPTKDYFHTLTDQFNTQFNVETTFPDFNELTLNRSGPQSEGESKSESDQSSSDQPSSIIPVVVTAAVVPLIAQVSQYITDSKIAKRERRRNPIALQKS